MCAFPTSSIRCIRNPLRRSAFIHMNVDCLLKDGQKHLFEGTCMGRTRFKVMFNSIYQFQTSVSLYLTDILQ